MMAQLWRGEEITRAVILGDVSEELDEIYADDAIVNVVTTDYTLDLESWDLHITLESVHSTHANRAASDDFNLQLKDVCWDLPLTAPVATPGSFNVDLWSTHQRTFSAMNT